MARQLKISTKRVEIDKANAQIVVAVAIASFVTVFCLIASQAIWTNNKYLAKVTDQKEKALDQLQSNLDAFKALQSSYSKFDKANENIIGGQRLGNGDNDGSNSKIILNALPSAYDFPAVTSSLEKIMRDNNIKGSISGTDDQLNQQATLSQPDPQPIPIEFTISIEKANYEQVQKLISVLQRSIRPIQITTFSLNGGQDNITLDLKAQTYWQPGKSVNIKEEVVQQ